MKILVTGGAGFIGSHLCEFLAKKNNEITVFTRSSTNLENIANIKKFLKIKKIDITDLTLVEKNIKKLKPDIVYHLAGETSHKQSFQNPIYDVDVNSKSTLNILETIRKFHPSCKFILGSTFIVIGRPKKLPVTEDSPSNPTTIYGANRLASEHFCKIYHDVYNLDTRIFRITNSFGPREKYSNPQKNAVNYLIYQAYKGNEITIYNSGKFFRDLIYISDVISGINKISTRGKAGNLYWISSGKKTWFYNIGKLLHNLTGTPVKYIAPPNYTKKVDVGNFLADNSKLRALGWKPRYELKQSFQLTLEYFRSNNL